ncbi:MAG: FAD-dependent oxidoreductase [Spirochaetes bacterium]|nr:FAD-dependent oxidoreductase [Spirochaetota bacterium]
MENTESRRAPYAPLQPHGPSPLEKTGLPPRLKELAFDVVVIGGGIAGVCAAVSSARHGARTALVQDRPVLGGNASSEIRVCVAGAWSRAGGKKVEERETGIVEELLLENRFDNPQDSYHVWDHLLYDFAVREKNLDLFMNTQAVDAVMDGERIAAAVCWQASTETRLILGAAQFIDCSGDGLLAAAAGAPYRTGREAASEFDESYAPPVADGWQMGASLLLSTRDLGRPTPYRAPSFAVKVDKALLKRRGLGPLAEGFWWVELGSDADIIADQEENRHKLMGYVHGLWDYIKNSGEFPQAANLALDWVGSVPGKRESRRFIGDYILSQKDLVERRHFEDTVAFGGWSLDEHCPGGLLSPDLPPSFFHQHFDRAYEIPFRCLRARTISNLLFAGRNISQTHIALSSTRVIGTCASMGQAAGTAAALCAARGVGPRELGERHLGELQEALLLNDAYLPRRPASGAGDLARRARLRASSTRSGGAENLVDGVPRDEDEVCHHWESDGLPATLTLDWDQPTPVGELVLKLDTNLHRKLWKVMKAKRVGNQDPPDPVPPELVKSLAVEGLVDGEWVPLAAAVGIRRRLVRLSFEARAVRSVRIQLLETYGHPHAKLFEVRCYERAPDFSARGAER